MKYTSGCSVIIRSHYAFSFWYFAHISDTRDTAVLDEDSESLDILPINYCCIATVGAHLKSGAAPLLSNC